MTKSQEKKWENAKVRAEKINQILKDGYLVFVGDKQIKTPFIVTGWNIYTQEGRNSQYIWFENIPNSTRELFGTVSVYAQVPTDL